MRKSLSEGARAIPGDTIFMPSPSENHDESLGEYRCPEPGWQTERRGRNDSKRIAIALLSLDNLTVEDVYGVDFHRY